ncbi:MAG: hypothetical protein WCF17_15710, partial [Terracidiphilus sp.]
GAAHNAATITHFFIKRTTREKQSTYTVSVRPDSASARDGLLSWQFRCFCCPQYYPLRDSGVITSFGVSCSGLSLRAKTAPAVQNWVRAGPSDAAQPTEKQRYAQQFPLRHS